MAKSNKKRGKIRKNIYLDYAAASTPNPSSVHELGMAVKKKLENARKEVAGELGARSSEIIFTSGGTESNNLAIQGVVYAIAPQFFFGSSEKIRRPHIITTNIEHPSVLETFRLLEKRMVAEVSVVEVEANGVVDPKKIKKAIKPNTILISVMYANNEIGTIQPIKEIAKEIRHYRKQKEAEKEKDFLGSSEKIPRPLENPFLFPFFHTDAVQAVNYLDLNVEKLGVDLLTLSGSKILGAGRIGVLFKKASVPLANISGGGDQEMGLRPGTENLAEILKFSSALKTAQKIEEKESKRLILLRDYFLNTLEHSNILKNFGMLINGDLGERLPNNINITFPKIPSDLLVMELSAKGIMASSKSACESGSQEGSYVIKALRPDASPEIGGLRFSMGHDTKKEDIDCVVKSLNEILTKLKKWYN
ncbi:MAG: cysteine desulfurase family protein [Minisyncoccia bacterium]